MDRIVDISTKATGWTVDFYIWFNWQGDGIDPGENFQVIDEEIESKKRLRCRWITDITMLSIV